MKSVDKKPFDEQLDRHENAIAIIITLVLFGVIALISKYTGWLHLF